MNITEFKKNDIITRIEPIVYLHNDIIDSSYCGTRLVFIGVDEKSKIIIFIDTFDEVTLSYASESWDDGWEYFPEILYIAAKRIAKIKTESNKK